jgi:hypothetical protein
MKLRTRTLTAAVFAAFLLFPVACGTADIAALVQTLGGAASSIADIEGNSNLAAKLKVDTTAAADAVLNWKSGTPATEVIEALNLVQDDLDLFPVGSEATALIDLAIGTTEAIITEITSKAPAASSVAVAHVAHRAVTLTKPPKNAAEFKKQYQTIIAANPQLQKYALK